jgi:hypothetical protein
MSRLSREDPSWDCQDPEHAQNTSELPKLPKEALVTAVIIHEVISDRVIELNPKTMDSRTDEAEASHGMVSLSQPSSQPNVSGIDEGLRCMEVEPTGRSKRKRQAFAIGDLHTCVCGENR